MLRLVSTGGMAARPGGGEDERCVHLSCPLERRSRRTPYVAESTCRATALLAGNRRRMARRPLALDAGTFPGVDVLVFVDWHGFGAPLAAALVPPASLGRARLILPGTRSGRSACSAMRTVCGIFPLARRCLFRRVEWVVERSPRAPTRGVVPPVSDKIVCPWASGVSLSDRGSVAAPVASLRHAGEQERERI